MQIVKIHPMKESTYLSIDVQERSLNLITYSSNDDQILPFYTAKINAY